MEEGSIRTESVFRLSWPIFLQNITVNLVVLVDFWFYSWLSDETAAVVGQLYPLTWLGTFVVPVFASTGIAVSSQYLGAKRMERVVPTYMANLVLTGLLGLGVAAGFWIFRADFGRWLGMSEGLNQTADAFNGAMSPLFFCLAIMMAYNAILSSRGMTHWAMAVSLMASLLNVVLDGWFVFGLGMEVRGVAMASVISCGLATVVSIYLVHHRMGVRFYLRNAWRDLREVTRPLLRIGVPNAAEPLCYCIQQIVLSGFIVSLGVQSMAANSYVLRFSMLIIAFSFSLSAGGQILMGHWVGARRFEDVNRSFYKILRISLATAAIFMGALWLVDDWVLGLFTEDPAIVALGKRLIAIAFFLETARVLNIVGGHTLKALGDARFTATVGMVFIWSLLPAVWAIDRWGTLTIEVVWICHAVDELIRGLISLWRWRTGKWQGMGVAG